MENPENLAKAKENLANREFINIAKDGLQKGFDEKKIFKILRKEGLFDEEVEKILFQTLEEMRQERLANPDLEIVKPKKNNRLFKWTILEIIVSIIALSIFPFRIPPSKALKKFSVFLILVTLAWVAYYSFIETKKTQLHNSEKELLQQLKTIWQLQKDFQ
jgi:hypothetical protein